MKSIKEVVVIVALTLVLAAVYAEQNDTPAVFLFSVVGIFTVATGWCLGSTKGRGAAGFWFSLFLGPIGWIIVAVLKPSQKVLDMRAKRIADILRSIDKE